MKKNYNPISDVRNETVDLTKRLFRNISDAVHNLDDIRARATSVCNLFTRAADTQRVRLRDCCERLIFCDKSGYGRKAEELLWRKGYYEVISSAKRLRKGSNLDWLPDEAALVYNHVLAGVGQYHHLLSRLQFDCGIDLRGIVDNPVLYLDEGLKKGKTYTVSVNGRNKTVPNTNNSDSCNFGENFNNSEWALNIAHRCLIYLGDLSRYLLDVQPGWDYGLAAHYYTQALILKPEAGMPFNQLGTLSGSQNYSLDAVYNYMRCMCCPHTFEGAEGNLLNALEKTSHWLENGGRTESASPVSRLIARLLYLTRVWFCSRTSILSLHKVCDEFLSDLPKCLSNCNNSGVDENATQPLEIDDLETFVLKRAHLNEQPTYLSEDMLFKMVVILLMCMKHLEKKGSEEFMRVVAFILAVISQLLQKALDQLEQVLPLPSAPSLTTLTPVAEDNIDTNGLSKRRRRRRRRRRRGSSEGSSDMSEGEVVYVSSTDSDISEEELVFDENNSDDTDADDETMLNGKATGENGLGDKTSAEIEKDDINSNSAITSSLSNVMRKPATLWSSLDKENGTFCHVHNLMQQGYLLQTIKICFDWLSNNMEVLKSCSQGCKPLVNRTALFLNYLMQVPLPPALKTEKNPVFTSSITVNSLQCQPYFTAGSELNNDDVKSYDNDNDFNGINKLHSNYCSNINNEIEELPLPEDLSLRGLPMYNNINSKLVWKRLLSQRLSSEQECYLRVCKFVKLGMRLSDENETTSLLFDSEKNWFSVENGNGQKNTCSSVPGTVVSKSKSNTTSSTSSITSTKNFTDIPSKQEGVSMKHDKLMQDMGQLWLRAEVKELETKVKKTAAPLPPYLVLDCDALTLHCPLVKQLAASRKFVILIPTVVVSALDEQKRSSGRVRDTIRWLESQFRHGNRFLRAQRANEHSPLPLIKYPKKKDKEAWLFFQIVECCHFLNSQGGSKDSGLVTLLTGSPTLLTGSNTSGFSPLGIVNSAGISIEHIESFHSKWKSSYKSHG